MLNFQFSIPIRREQSVPFPRMRIENWELSIGQIFLSDFRISIVGTLGCVRYVHAKGLIVLIHPSHGRRPWLKSSAAPRLGAHRKEGQRWSGAQWSWMLPLRRAPPSVGPPEIEMLNMSLSPGSPLSITLTVNVHGAPLLTHVPPNVAVAALTVNALNVTLCTLAPVAWLTYCRSPWIGA